MTESNNQEIVWVFGMIVMLGIIALGIFVFAGLIPGSPVLALSGKLFDVLFATSSVQALWYVTRAAGVVAYLLLWLSTAWGLAVSSKIFDPLLHRFFTYDMHQFISLLALGFVALHVVVLRADKYLPFSIAQILVPFAAPYRPVWVGVGVIGFYLMLLVSVTFYVRQRIGYPIFRVIHYASFVAYLAALAHGLLAGTDSSLWTTQLIYAASALVVIFLFVYRIVMALPSLQPETSAR
jgi:sulfoxide reductase heme-binding subunit YedZ